ncbi:MAG: hypothetical protein ACTSYA_10360 [Candidatus Kariarchaeaceae archaeon]
MKERYFKYTGEAVPVCRITSAVKRSIEQFGQDRFNLLFDELIMEFENDPAFSDSDYLILKWLVNYFNRIQINPRIDSENNYFKKPTMKKAIDILDELIDRYRNKHSIVYDVLTFSSRTLVKHIETPRTRLKVI